MIAIASDHGGYNLKEHIKAYLVAKGISCQDFGTDSTASCDYPVFGKAAAEAVASGACVRRDDPPPQQRQYAGDGRGDDRAQPGRAHRRRVFDHGL